MNGWDLFTWLMASGLLIGVLAIFGFFLKDVSSVLTQGEEEE